MPGSSNGGLLWLHNGGTGVPGMCACQPREGATQAAIHAAVPPLLVLGFQFRCMTWSGCLLGLVEATLLALSPCIVQSKSGLCGRERCLRVWHSWPRGPSLARAPFKGAAHGRLRKGAGGPGRVILSCSSYEKLLVLEGQAPAAAPVLQRCWSQKGMLSCSFVPVLWIPVDSSIGGR